MFFSNTLTILSLLPFSLLLRTTFGFEPLVSGYNCFNQAKFPAKGYYEKNLNTLLAQVSYEEVESYMAPSRSENGVMNASFKHIDKEAISVYALAQCWKTTRLGKGKGNFASC